MVPTLQHPDTGTPGALDALTRSIDGLETECVRFDLSMRTELAGLLHFAHFDHLYADHQLPSAMAYDVWRRIVQLQSDTKLIQLVEVWSSEISHNWLLPYTLVSVKSLPV